MVVPAASDDRWAAANPVHIGKEESKLPSIPFTYIGREVKFVHNIDD